MASSNLKKCLRISKSFFHLLQLSVSDVWVLDAGMITSRKSLTRLGMQHNSHVLPVRRWYPIYHYSLTEVIVAVRVNRSELSTVPYI